MIKCFVCGEFIDEDCGDEAVEDVETGKLVHDYCVLPLDGFEIINLKRWEDSCYRL